MVTDGALLVAMYKALDSNLLFSCIVIAIYQLHETVIRSSCFDTRLVLITVCSIAASACDLLKMVSTAPFTTSQ